jgi:STE24 endopeptidase
MAPAPAADRSDSSLAVQADRRRLWSLWALCAVVVVVGVASQVLRPLAPAITDVEDPSRWFDAAHLARVDAYWGPVYVASLVGLVVRIALPLLIAGTAGGRGLIGRVVALVGAHRPARAAAVVAVAILVLTDVVLAPVSFWRGYLHEDAFGFRVQGFGGWARDWFLARAPSWLAVGVLVLGGYALARRLPRAWPPVAGLLGAALTVVVVYAAPFVLEPLRFTTVPLDDGPLRAEVEGLATTSGIRAETVLVADASRRTIRHNAYVSGLGQSRRVVLYDTLVDDRPREEVMMIVAHELGHERNADLLRGTLVGAAGSVVVALAIGWFVRWRVATGRQATVLDPRGAAAIVAFVVVLNAVSMPVQSALSRRAEAAADLAALDLTGDPDTFVTMKAELARQNLSHPDPPAWVRILWSSHPSAAARLTMGERWSSVEAGPPGDDPIPGGGEDPSPRATGVPQRP